MTTGELRHQIDEYIDSLSPEQIRVGDYRIVYLVDEDSKVVSVTLIAHRSKVYDD